MSHPSDFNQFVQAQAPVMVQVRRELGEGRKASHWMWFVFPELTGLGHSAMARQYAIRSLVEAHAYLAHPVLGPRLVECTDLVNKVEGRSVHEIFGSPDDLKFRSSMTLFSSARAPRDQRYEWAYLFGAVCPARGVGAALVPPFVNTEAMNLHLAEIST